MRIAVILVLIAACGSARAFDCTKPTVPAEFVICSDPDLMTIADQRRHAWDEALGRVGGEQRAALLADQRRWLRDYPRSCGVDAQGKPAQPIKSEVVECFKRASEARTAYLRAYPPAGIADGGCGKGQSARRFAGDDKNIPCQIHLCVPDARQACGGPPLARPA